MVIERNGNSAPKKPLERSENMSFSLQEPHADEGAREGEEGVLNFGEAVKATTQAAEAV